EFHCFYWLANQVMGLLEKGSETSASYSQWTAFYHQLVNEAGMSKGNYVDYLKIKSAILKAWPLFWLSAMNLVPSESESS
ncbi:hypothetical protein R0J89_21735, partial [Psychrobacter sp. SIMBA_152]